jgi:hypothetical protein
MPLHDLIERTRLPRSTLQAIRAGRRPQMRHRIILTRALEPKGKTMPTARQPEDVIAQLVGEMRKLRGAGVIASAAMLTYVIIDAMAHISRPTIAARATNADFKAWVDRYMHVREPAEYRYSGEDLYSARCDLLHTFSNQLRLNRKHFGYHDGYPHRYRPDIAPNVVMLSVDALADDLWQGVSEFLAEERAGNRYPLIVQRFNDIFAFVPFQPTS